MPSYREGREARLAGVPRASNPYPEATPMNKLWDEGWSDSDTIMKSQNT